MTVLLLLCTGLGWWWVVMGPVEAPAPTFPAGTVVMQVKHQAGSQDAARHANPSGDPAAVRSGDPIGGAVAAAQIAGGKAARNGATADRASREAASQNGRDGRTDDRASDGPDKDLDWVGQDGSRTESQKTGGRAAWARGEVPAELARRIEEDAARDAASGDDADEEDPAGDHTFGADRGGESPGTGSAKYGSLDSLNAAALDALVARYDPAYAQADGQDLAPGAAGGDPARDAADADPEHPQPDPRPAAGGLAGAASGGAASGGTGSASGGPRGVAGVPVAGGGGFGGSSGGGLSGGSRRAGDQAGTAQAGAGTAGVVVSGQPSGTTSTGQAPAPVVPLTPVVTAQSPTYAGSAPASPPSAPSAPGAVNSAAVDQLLAGLDPDYGRPVPSGAPVSEDGLVVATTGGTGAATGGTIIESPLPASSTSSGASPNAATSNTATSNTASSNQASSNQATTWSGDAAALIRQIEGRASAGVSAPAEDVPGVPRAPSVSVVGAPGSSYAGGLFSVEWEISGGEHATDIRIRWGTRSGMYTGSTPSQSGGPGSYADVLSMGSGPQGDGPQGDGLYFVVEAVVDGQWVRSQEVFVAFAGVLPGPPHQGTPATPGMPPQSQGIGTPEGQAPSPSSSESSNWTGPVVPEAQSVPGPNPFNPFAAFVNALTAAGNWAGSAIMRLWNWFKSVFWGDDSGTTGTSGPMTQAEMDAAVQEALNSSARPGLDEPTPPAGDSGPRGAAPR